MALVAVAGLVVLWLIPGVVERRRLRPLGSPLQPAAERVADLAVETRLARPPTAVVGTSAQRDAFCYGVPGRYWIALPPAVAVRWQDRDLFDPLVRHELAHLRYRDVTLAWLARAVWYVLLPILALPVIGGLVSGDVSLLPSYLWRVGVFALTVQLVSSALIRSREHDADLRAARGAGGLQAVAGALALTREPASRTWYRRPFANHPSPSRRLAVVERPELAADVTFLDGFAAAFLAALAFPLVETVFVTARIGSGPTGFALLAGALATGPLLAGSVGLGLWRAAIVQRVVGGSTWPGPAALGVAAGLVLGRVVSLTETGTEGAGDVGIVGRPVSLAVVALAGFGATVLAAGLGELWADAAPAMRRARDFLDRRVGD